MQIAKYMNNVLLDDGCQNFHCYLEIKKFYECLRNLIQLLKKLKHGSEVLQDIIFTSTDISNVDISEVNNNLLACESLLVSLWEIINTGHWKDVDIFWRQFYTIVSCVKTLFLLLQNNNNSALMSCDKGIIMGAPLPNDILIYEMADLIQLSLNEMKQSDNLEISKVCKSAIPIPILPNPKQLQIYDSPSIQHFIMLTKAEQPFVMKQVIDHWPAINKWDPHYLKKYHGDRLVPIEIGSSYTSNSWSQKLMKLNAFVDSYILDQSEEIAYLAQYEIFNQIRILKKDIIPLDYCALSDSQVIINGWIGPKGTVSPLHHDPYHNLFCQVYGHKRFILFDKNEMLHAHEHHLLHNTSQIDIESEKVFDTFPSYKNTEAWYVDLQPGDVLYIPPKWWHHVRSLSISFSVSFWCNKFP